MLIRVTLNFKATNLRVDRSSDDSILISWSVQPPPVKTENHLEYLPSITLAKNNSWINTTDWITYQYYLFVNLRVHTSYMITVYVRDTKLGKTYPPANYLKATTGIAGKYYRLCYINYSVTNYKAVLKGGKKLACRTLL